MKSLYLIFITLLIVTSCKNKAVNANTSSDHEKTEEQTQMKEEKHFAVTFTYDDVKDNKKLNEFGCLCNFYLENENGGLVFIDNRESFGLVKIDGIFEELTPTVAEEKAGDNMKKEFNNAKYKVVINANYVQDKKMDSGSKYFGDILITSIKNDTILLKKIIGVCSC